MGRHQIVLPNDISQRLRRMALKKGDISKIVEEALRKHLAENKT